MAFAMHLLISIEILLVNDAGILAVSHTDHNAVGQNAFVIIQCFVAFEARRESYMDPIATLWRKHFVKNGAALREM